MAQAYSHITGLSVVNNIADTQSAIQTFYQLGGKGVVFNKVLAVPGHLRDSVVNSLEYVSVTEGGKVGEHTQTTDEIYYLTQGTGLLTTNGHVDEVSAGDLIIAPKGTRHSIENLHKETLNFLVVEMSTADTLHHDATIIKALPKQLDEDATFFSNNGISRLASIDLAPYFSAPWGMLTLIELPVRASTKFYKESHDQNVLILKGNAIIKIEEDMTISSEASGLNIFFPKNVKHQIINQSTVDKLYVLLLGVNVYHDRKHKQVPFDLSKDLAEKH